MQMQIIVIDNNATACFDCMLEAPNNLVCLQHGADPQYIKLHAQKTKGTQVSSETQIWSVKRIQHP